MSGILVGAVYRLTRISRVNSRGRRVGLLARVRGGGFSGHGRIVGTVSVAGAPAARLVRCYDSATGVFLAETWSSASDGVYRFDHLSLNRRFLVVAHDHLEQYNAAVADLLIPEAMP